MRQVQTSLTQGFIRGDGADRMTKEIAKQMGVSAGKAARLVMTETAYFSAQAQQDCYKEMGVERFEVVETLDSHTCELCGGLDGKVLPMSAYEPGVTAPPFHPWCRGCTAPWFPDNDAAGERAARDHEGKTYYVPADMKYEEWTKKQFTGGGKNGIIKTGGDGMDVDIEIDQFTPCLLDAKTGKLVDTAFTPAAGAELRKVKGWGFDWTDKALDQDEIYKLTLAGSDEIQGLVALRKMDRDRAFYVHIAESAPHNLGPEKRFSGVGGHLFAIAAHKSMEAGYGGYFFMDAKNLELVKHYQKTLGAMWLGIPHEYRMIVDEEAAARLLEIYTFEEGTSL